MDKELFTSIQFFTNICASSAATIAIYLHIKSVLSNKGNPLKITKAVVYNQPTGKANYYFVIKNKRPYHVRINEVACYLKDQYILRKYPDSPPTYYKTFSNNDKLFEDSSILEVAPSAEENLVIKNVTHLGATNILCLNVWTSYGYYEHVVENLTVYESGKVEVSDVNSWQSFNNKPEDRDHFYIEFLKYWLWNRWRKNRTT